MVPARPTDLSLLASMAVAGVVEAALSAAGVPGHRALLKWPNDVLVGDGKVAGVLVQSTDPPLAVVGVGLNVNARVDLREDRPDEEWPVGPRSLVEVAGRPLDLPSLTRDLVVGLVERVRTGLDGPALEEYRARCHTLGKRVAFTEGGQRLTGTAVDIDPDGGGLVVRLEGGEARRVTAGEVRHVRSERG
jgi:BirA family biotin operon repressor/biotin-[acetyl-CoA-carboxylase] ligase